MNGLPKGRGKIARRASQSGISVPLERRCRTHQPKRFRVKRKKLRGGERSGGGEVRKFRLTKRSLWKRRRAVRG